MCYFLSLDLLKFQCKGTKNILDNILKLQVYGMPKSQAFCIWRCYICSTRIQIIMSSTKHNYIICNYKLLHQNKEFYSLAFEYIQNVLNWGAWDARVHLQLIEKMWPLCAKIHLHFLLNQQQKVFRMGFANQSQDIVIIKQLCQMPLLTYSYRWHEFNPWRK